MATRTAGAGSTTWTAAAFSGGSATVAADEVVVPTGATLTISAANTVLCRSISVTGTGTLVFAATTSVANIGDATAGTGNVALSVASGATITLTGVGTINFVSTSATQQTITTNGKTLGIINVNGIGSSYVLGSALTLATSGTFNIANGIFDTANFAMTMNSFNINNGTKTLTLGSSAITLITSGSAWATNFFTNLTITTNTAVVTLTAVIANANTLILGAVDWKGLSFVVPNGGQMNINQSGATIKSLTFTGRNAKTDFVGLNGSIVGNLTLTGTLTINGNSAINRVLFSNTQTRGTAIAVNVPTTPTFSNVDFMDIVAGGASAPWNLSGITGRSGDAGGNSGITFTTPATQTNTGATGNWSDATKWTSRVPLPQDDVVISTGSGTITYDMPRLGKDINFTGFTGTYTGGINWESYGSYTLASGMTYGPIASGGFGGRGTHTITTAGKTPGGTTTTFNGPGGTYTLQDAFTSSGAISLVLGTLNTNNQAVTSLTFVNSVTNTRSLILGTTVWTLTQTTAATVWNTGSTGLTLSAASSTIVIGTASANTRTFIGGDQTYGTLTYTVASSAGILAITGANRFSNLNINGSRTLALPVNTVTTVSTITTNAATGNILVLKSGTSGTAAFLSKPVGGLLSLDWLTIRDVRMSQPYTFYAGANSTNTSNNTNILFIAPPVGIHRYQGIGATANSTSVTGTLVVGATAGSLLVVYWGTSTNPGTVTGPTGFTQAVAAQNGTATTARVWYKVATGGETAVMVSQTNSVVSTIFIQEVVGWAGTPTLDVTSSNTSLATTTGSTTATTGPTNAIPAWAVAGFMYNSSPAGSVSWSNNYQEEYLTAASGNQQIAALPLIIASAQSTTHVWTTARNSAQVLAVFKDVPLAGGESFFPFF